MIASLPMYDRPETAAANDRLWQAVRDHLAAPGDAEATDWPDRLTRGGDPWKHWLAPELALSQTCGLPYRTQLHRRVTLIGAGDHRLKHCPPGHYRSVLVMRRGDRRGDPALWYALRLACNDPASQSGWAAPQTLALAGGPGFRKVTVTGSHRASVQAVERGQADIAAIDEVTWRMMRRWDNVAAGLSVVARTASTPALPYITSAGRDPWVLYRALTRAIAGLSREDRKWLQLYGVVAFHPRQYMRVPTPAFPPARAPAVQ